MPLATCHLGQQRIEVKSSPEARKGRMIEEDVSIPLGKEELKKHLLITGSAFQVEEHI